MPQIRRFFYHKGITSIPQYSLRLLRGKTIPGGYQQNKTREGLLINCKKINWLVSWHNPGLKN